MTINTIADHGTTTLSLTGRLDTTTAPQLAETLNALPADISTLILDLSDLEYISSAGLRVILSAQKKMKAQSGSLEIHHPSELVMEIFDVTGFSDILTIIH